ncbi:MAG: DUF1844 domain-containing protein [Planctomycetota bacterium]
MTDGNIEKKVDEEWKQKASEEKKHLSEDVKDKESVELPPPDFNTYLTSMSVQVLISLGQIENPITKKKEIDLPQGRYIIDLLTLLKEKTKGNLTKEEEDNFRNMLSNLQLLYVRVNKS